MKTTKKFPKICLLLAIGLGLVHPLFSQGGPPPHAGQGKGREARESTRAEAPDEWRALDMFLSMSDAELDAVAAAIAQVRALSPDQRRELKVQLQGWTEAPPGERTQARRGWTDGGGRQAWRTHLDSLSVEARNALVEQVHALPPEQRAAKRMEILRSLGKLDGETVQE